MSSTVLVYGSGECEQLGKNLPLRALGVEFGEDDVREIKRPKKLAIFDMAADLGRVPVFKLLCGGMHTVVLASSGAVYTWGCNDEGALGRPGMEDKPLLVKLPERMTDISAGDSHSIFFSTESNKAYFCGLYRVSFC